MDGLNARQQQLQQNVGEIRDRMAEAAVAANRAPDDVQLIAVTKYVGADVTRDLVLAGCHDLGESRPQLLWDKATALDDLPQIRWHQIGHLQRNKVRRTLPLLHLLHSVDSARLLNAVNAELTQQHGAFDASTLTKSTTTDVGNSEPCDESEPSQAIEPLDVLLEVNTSGDAAKHGFSASGCRQAIEQAMTLPHIRIRGLMCMAGLGGGEYGARQDFDRLRQLKEQYEQELGVDLPELSMGMSGDFEVAIAAGATLVRVGSALFKDI